MYFLSLIFFLQAKDILNSKLPTWQEKCSNIDKVPDSVTAMIEGLAIDPGLAQEERYNRVRTYPQICSPEYAVKSYGIS